MLPWLCLGRSCGPLERCDFRRRKKTGQPAHSKNSKAWPLVKPFPWILSRVETILTCTQRHAWMLPWLCFGRSCAPFEKWRFSTTKKTGKPAQQKLKSVTPGQVYPVDFEPSGDDPYVDTASRVDASVALSRPLMRSLRKMQFSTTKKNREACTAKTQKRDPCASLSRGY